MLLLKHSNPVEFRIFYPHSIVIKIPHFFLVRGGGGGGGVWGREERFSINLFKTGTSVIHLTIVIGDELIFVVSIKNAGKQFVYRF